MIIAVPKEIKSSENRIALTPAGALELTKHGHEVFIQKSAGENSGFLDAEYEGAGAKILSTAEECYAKAEMIMKVKEPIESEYKLIREGQLVFTYFHFASHEPLTQAMIDNGSICLAYETVQLADGKLPLLIPMSEVAGRMATQQGAKYLEKPMGGKGILLGGVPGVRPAKVIVIGGGVVGTHAAKIAAGFGASVLIADINLERLRYLNDIMPPNVITIHPNEMLLRKELKRADLVIGAVLVTGAKAPHLIKRYMLADMQPGAVLVDVAVDQGGCFETTRPTTHDDPVYMVDDVLHYAVANMPGAVPYTSTIALTNVTLPYAINLANKGWKQACQENNALRLGLNIIEGKVTYKGVAEAFDLEYHDVEKFL